MMIAQKATILCIYEILKMYTDETHILSAEKIREKLKTVYCILRSLADSDAFQSGRCAEHNGRPETLAIIN